MTAGLSTTSQFTNTMPKFIAEAKLTLSQEGAMQSTMKTMPLAKKSGKTLNIPTWNQPTAYALVEGVEMAQAQQFSDTNVAITIAENAGVQVLFTNLALDTIREDALRMAARSMANAVAVKRDKDLLSLCSGFSNRIGSAGTSMGLGHIMAAKVSLLAQTRPVEGQIHGIFHPYMLHAVYEDMLNISSGAFGTTGPQSGNSISEDIIRNYEWFDLAGIRVHVDPNITADGSDDGSGSVHASDALIYVPYDEESIEDEYKPSLRATELNMVATYGYGEYADAWGREMLFDMAAVTS
jgi:hypothetical protein